MRRYFRDIFYIKIIKVNKNCFGRLLPSLIQAQVYSLWSHNNLRFWYRSGNALVW